MRYRKSFPILMTILLWSMILAACGSDRGGGFAPGLRAWVDQPPYDLTRPLEPYTLKAHARNEASGGVNQIVFLVNSVPIGTVPTDSSKPLVYAELQWNPSMPGEYIIQAQAVGSGGNSLSEPVRICIASEIESPGACAVIPKTQAQITDTPGGATVPQEKPAYVFDFKAAPDLVFIGACKEAQDQRITFEGAINDVSQAIEVDLQAYLQSESGKQQEIFITVMTAQGNNTYIATYDLASVDPAILESKAGRLYYVVKLMDGNKNFYATSQEQFIQAIPCGLSVAGGEQKPVEFKLGVAPGTVYLGQCQKGEVQAVTLEGYVSDTSQAVQADIRAYLQNYAGQRQELLTQPMTPSGNNAYTTAIDLRQVDPKMLEYQSGLLIFTMSLKGQDGAYYATSQEQFIQAIPCGLSLPGGEQKPVEIKLGAAPGTVYVGQCQKGEVQAVTLEGYVSDASQAVQVDIRAYLQNYAGQRQELFTQPMTPSGGNSYTATIDLRQVDPKMLEYQNGLLVFTMSLKGKDGAYYTTSQEQFIQAIPCQYAAPVVPTDTPQPPEIPVAPQPPPPQDSTPPTVKASPSTDVVYVDTYGKGCDPSLPTSVTFQAYVSDDSGISQVLIYWYYAKTGGPYSAQSAGMSGGGNNWAFTLTPDHADDTLVFWVEAWDVYNNHGSSQGPNTVAVAGCKAQ